MAVGTAMISGVVAKKKPKYGFMPLTYMWCPHQETERADGHDRPHHHPIAEDVLSCMDTEQVGDHAEGRQGDDIDLGMTEEPEQVLKQRSEEHTSELQSQSNLVCRLLLEKKKRRHR